MSRRHWTRRSCAVSSETLVRKRRRFRAKVRAAGAQPCPPTPPGAGQTSSVVLPGTRRLGAIVSEMGGGKHSGDVAVEKLAPQGLGHAKAYPWRVQGRTTSPHDEVRPLLGIGRTGDALVVVEEVDLARVCVVDGHPSVRTALGAGARTDRDLPEPEGVWRRPRIPLKVDPQGEE